MGERTTLYRLTIDRGDPLDGYLRVWDGPRSRGVLKNLSGYTGTMQLRAEADSPDVILAFFVECGTFTPVDNRTGQPVTCNVHFAATQTQTAALPDFGLGVFDIELTDTFGRPWTIAPGVAVLRKDVSREP